jgi:hypothetical protein
VQDQTHFAPHPSVSAEWHRWTEEIAVWHDVTRASTEHDERIFLEWFTHCHGRQQTLGRAIHRRHRPSDGAVQRLHRVRQADVEGGHCGVEGLCSSHPEDWYRESFGRYHTSVLANRVPHRTGWHVTHYHVWVELPILFRRVCATHRSWNRWMGVLQPKAVATAQLGH